MLRAHLLFGAVILLGAGTCCRRSELTSPLVIHVWRDASAPFASKLRQANLQFALSQPHLKSGKGVMVATNEGNSFPMLLKRFSQSAPELLILNSQTDMPEEPAMGSQLGKAELVCGRYPAFIPASASGEEREAVQTYLTFLISHCDSTTAAQPASAQQGQQIEAGDPHRPRCTNPRCKEIKAFLESHYCGESQLGGGPDEGCDSRGRKKTESSTKVTADYVCRWNPGERKPRCRMQGEPSPEVRKMLLEEMRRVGLPHEVEAEKAVHFTVLESPSGWSLMAANYHHISGPDLILCQVVVVADPSGRIHVLRNVPLGKTDADAPEITTWSPVDIADVDGDGKLEVVLEGDDDEDYWFEVVTLQDGSFQTIFSGLGYYP
jgi:hypothetical protein